MRPFKVARQKISRNEYCRLHQRVRKVLGKANHCSNDSCIQKSNRFEWALKKGKPYSDNPDDYFPLCQSCHRRYDMLPGTRKKQSQSAKGNRARAAVFARVHQFDLDGNYLNTFETVAEAAIKTGTARSSIWFNLAGTYKKANNFIWKRASKTLTAHGEH